MGILKKCGILFFSLILIGCGSSNKEDNSFQSTLSVSKSESEQNSKVQSNQTTTSVASQKINESQKSKTSLTSEQTAKRNKVIFQAIVYAMVKDYASISFSDLDEKNWEVKTFDDTSSDEPGVYFVTTKVSLDGVALKQPVIAVFTFYPDSETYTRHFLSIGDKVFENDGYIDEIYEKYLGDTQ